MGSTRVSLSSSDRLSDRLKRRCELSSKTTARAESDTIKNIQPRAITADEERCEKGQLTIARMQQEYSNRQRPAFQDSRVFIRCISSVLHWLFDPSVASVVYFLIQLFRGERENLIKLTATTRLFHEQVMARAACCWEIASARERIFFSSIVLLPEYSSLYLEHGCDTD